MWKQSMHIKALGNWGDESLVGADLLESGTDFRYIQELLGHKSSKTTELYTHVSTNNIQNIISPFDNL